MESSISGIVPNDTPLISEAFTERSLIAEHGMYILVKAQALILSVINSPVMVRVPVDRLMNMLNRALEASADDVQKADVKDAFASMLQNLFSFLSLKVNYLTDRKNDEAGELARQAGEDLADCIRGIATVFAEDSGTVVEIRNPLATAQAQADFLKKTLSMAKDNSDILKKTNDYKDNLRDTFNLFDIYSSTIGPSILFHRKGHKDHWQGIYAGFNQRPYKSGRLCPENGISCCIGNRKRDFRVSGESGKPCGSRTAAERTRLQHPGGKCCEERD